MVNGDFMHGVNEVDGHVGTQEGYLSNAAVGRLSSFSLVTQSS